MAIELLTLEEISKLPKGVNGGYIIRYLSKGHPQRPYKSASWQFEQRLVAEALLGRPLKKAESIHHKNGDKLDNMPLNLQLMNKSSHPRLHNPLKGEFIQCLNCGNPFYRPRAWINQGRGLYCSPKCGATSPTRIASAQKNLTGRKPDVALNELIAKEKDNGKTWRELAQQLGKSISTLRDRYRWFKRNIEGGLVCP